MYGNVPQMINNVPLRIFGNDMHAMGMIEMGQRTVVEWMRREQRWWNGREKERERNKEERKRAGIQWKSERERGERATAANWAQKWGF